MRTLILAFTLLMAHMAVAQSLKPGADSLWHVVQHPSTPDSDVREAYTQLVANSTGTAKTEALVAQCGYLAEHDHFVEALEAVQTLQQLPASELNANLEITAQKLLGAIKGPLGDNPAAQQHYHQAIRLMDSLGVSDSSYEAHLGLADMFFKQAQANEALLLLTDILPDSNAMRGHALQYCFFLLSNAHYGLRDLELANHFRERSLQLTDSSNHESLNLTGRALVAQAQVQFMAKQHDAAVASCQQALAIAKKTQALTLLSRCYSGLGTTYGALGKRDLQEATFLELLKTAEASGNVEMLYIAHNNLSSAYFSQGRFEESVYRMVDANKYFVARINEKNQAALTRSAMEFSFEAERKEKAGQIANARLQLEAETARSRLLVGGLVALLLLMVLVVIAYRRIAKARKETAEKNEQLQQLDRLNKEIFGIISHDLRDPLMSLGILADSVGNTELSRQQLQQFAFELKTHVGQTSQVLENLLNWARAELGVDFSAQQSTDANQIVSEITTHLHSATETKELEVVNELPANTNVALHADILRIVLRNLLTNAVKYSHPGEEIFVGASPAGGIYVRDTGVGIAPETLSKLGNETVMSNMGTSNETGFGLGLYITFALLRKSGWQLTVESTLNRGTRFEFLPA